MSKLYKCDICCKQITSHTDRAVLNLPRAKDACRKCADQLGKIIHLLQLSDGKLGAHLEKMYKEVDHGKQNRDRRERVDPGDS